MISLLLAIDGCYTDSHSIYDEYYLAWNASLGDICLVNGTNITVFG